MYEYRAKLWLIVPDPLKTFGPCSFLFTLLGYHATSFQWIPFSLPIPSRTNIRRAPVSIFTPITNAAAPASTAKATITNSLKTRIAQCSSTLLA